MEALINAARYPEVRQFLESLANIPEVQGVALDVHQRFISLFRNELGRDLPVNDILKIWENQGRRSPRGWPEACRAANFPGTVSPIYLVIYTTMKEADFRCARPIPATILPDYAVFVETITPFIALADRSMHRPIRGGISGGSSANLQLSGTLGGLVKDINTGDVLLLSCHHVLLNVQDIVVQQARGDGGNVTANRVGETVRRVPLRLTGVFTFGALGNKVDAALAKVDTGVQMDPIIRLLSNKVTTVTPKSNISLYDTVIFVGKESDRQDARVFRFVALAKVTISGTSYGFHDVFEIEPRSLTHTGPLVQQGDSGSWVIKDNGQDELYGLLFAGHGSGQRALCCFMEDVLTELGQQAPQTTFDLY